MLCFNICVHSTIDFEVTLLDKKTEKHKHLQQFSYVIFMSLIYLRVENRNKNLQIIVHFNTHPKTKPWTTFYFGKTIVLFVTTSEKTHAKIFCKVHLDTFFKKAIKYKISQISINQFFMYACALFCSNCKSQTSVFVTLNEFIIVLLNQNCDKANKIKIKRNATTFQKRY